MKSTNEQLQKRGYIEIENIQEYNEYTTVELLRMLESEQPMQRSTGIIMLGDRDIGTQDIDYVVQKLMHEKALYTKIYICNFLTKQGVNAITVMIPYLGKIGNNQHKVLPNSISKKKSYPLARDIIARTIAKVDKEVFPIILESLRSCSYEQIRELIDVIGYMMFYNASLVTNEVVKVVEGLYVRYQKDTLIVWKITTCLSAIPLVYSQRLLVEIERNHEDTLIQEELQRTKRIVIRRGE